MWSMLEELFAPGRKHAHDERRRLALTRDEPGDTDPARGPTDLSSGRVTLRVPPSPPSADSARPDGEARDSTQDWTAVPGRISYAFCTSAGRRPSLSRRSHCPSACSRTWAAISSGSTCR